MSEGELVIDDYQLINCIATGTYSQIWEVADTRSSGERQAMKLLLPEAFDDSEQKRVLKHEARVAKALSHPGIVRFQKIVVDKHHAYFIMDHFRAPNLKQQIQNDLPAAQMRFRKIVEAICLALQYMHDQGWVHRDVKPENVLLNKGSEIRLIDFSLSARIAAGLSKLLAGKSKTIQGTRTYIAPETLRREPATPRTDMYSVGVTLFELLTGRPPFLGSTPNDLLRRHLSEKPPGPSQLNPNVTPEVDRIILRMLEKKPDKRFKDLNEVFSEFRSIQPFKKEIESSAVLKAAAEAREEEAAGLGERISSRHDDARSRRQQEADSPRQPTRGEPAKAPEQPTPAGKPAENEPRTSSNGKGSADSSRPRSKPAPVEPEDDLPFMDELPEIN